ncbi:MAG: hypothetical protein IJ760_04665 [Bacteroidales bacterium]|nr:hypothetical protein [Bacteroidales bacterium]
MELIQLFVTAASAAAPFLVPKIVDNKKEKRNSCVFTLKEIEDDPTLVMGPRGSSDYGFRGELYNFEDKPFTRQIAGVVATPGRKGNTVVVISGGFASGKSRMVYEFVRRNAASKGYKRVFAPKLHDLKADSLSELVRDNTGKKLMSPEDTLVVLDDVNNLFDYDGNGQFHSKGLFDFLRSLQEKGYRCVLTLTDAENGAADFIKFCKDSPSKVGLDSTNRKMARIQIEKITRNSKCHRWATEVYRNNGFSSVIGGYVPDLERAIEMATEELMRDEGLQWMLASIIVGAKFRHNRGLTRTFAQKMFEARAGVSEDYDRLFRTLANLGFIRNVDNESFEFSSTQLFFSFNKDCRNGKYENLEGILPDDPENEKRQIDWLISADANDEAVLWQRAVVHSRYVNSSVAYIREKLRARFPDDSEIPQEFVEGSIASLLERGSKDDYKWVKTAVDEGRATPDIQLVCALLRMAKNNVDIRDELVNLAEKWRSEKEIKPSVYYYRCVEELCDDYSGSAERIREVKKLAKQANNVELEMYYATLLNRAVTGNAAADFWKLVEENKEDFRLNSKIIAKYCAIVWKKTRNRLTEDLLVNRFFNQLRSNPELVRLDDGEDLRDTLSWAVITNLPTFEMRKRFYEDEDCLQEYLSGNDNLFGKMLIPVLDLAADKFRSHGRYLGPAKDLVRARLLCGTPDGAWFAGRRKVLNKYLNCVPDFKQWQADYEDLVGGRLYENNDFERNIVGSDTLSTAMNAIEFGLYKSSFDYDTFVSNLKWVKNKHKELGYSSMQPHAVSTIYAILGKLIDMGKSPEEIEVIRDLFGDDMMSTEGNLKCRAASLNSISDPVEMLEEINRVNSKYDADYPRLRNADHLATMLNVVCSRFSGNEAVVEAMGKLLGELKDSYSVLSLDYCRQKLRFQIDVQKSLDGADTDAVKGNIDDLIGRLLTVNVSNDTLNELYKMYDSAVICENTGIYVALDLLKAAASHEKLWTVKLLRTFLKKLSKTSNERLTSSEVKHIFDEVQQLIDDNYTTSYQSEAGKIRELQKEIKKKWGIRRLNINLPLASSNFEDRHKVWDYFREHGSLSQIGDSDLNQFLIRESVEVKKGGGLYDGSYYSEAMKEYESRNGERWTPKK